jgi:hypothetical protein
LFAALLLLPRLAAAEPESTPPPPECTATVDGHVVESKSHEPVAGATVAVDGRPDGETDEAGRFNLTCI